MTSSAYTGLRAGKSQENRMKTQKIKGIHKFQKEMNVSQVYGVPNLPSDNMNDIMQNQFMSEYVEKKKLRDDLI